METGRAQSAKQEMAHANAGMVRIFYMIDHGLYVPAEQAHRCAARDRQQMHRYRISWGRLKSWLSIPELIRGKV